MSVITKDLGAVSAYGLALEAGFEGTEQEYAELLASYGTVAQEAGESAQEAEAAKTAAQIAATEAQSAATSASGYKYDAQLYSNQANGYKNTARDAMTAAQSARDEAVSAKNTAVEAVDGFAAGAQQALDSVNEAGGNWKSLAEKQAGNSEAWAVGQRGGVDVPTTDATYHNNAKYYTERTASSGAQIITDATVAKTAAQTAQTGAETAQTAAETAATNAEASADRAETAQGKAEDAAESVSASAAQIQTNKEDITELKSGLTTVTGNTAIELTDGYTIYTSDTTYDKSNRVANNEYCYAVVPCSEGDAFTITGVGGYSPRLWAFGDGNNVLSKAGPAQRLQDKVIIAPSGTTELIINARIAEPHACYVGEYLVKSVDNLYALNNVPTLPNVQIKTKKVFESFSTNSKTYTFNESSSIYNYSDYAADSSYARNTPPIQVRNSVGELIYNNLRLNLNKTDKTSICMWTFGKDGFYLRRVLFSEFYERASFFLDDEYYAILNLYPTSDGYTDYEWLVDAIKIEWLNPNSGNSAYYVGAGGDYSTFTEMLTDLENDSADKVVYIYPGVYDIFTEVGGASRMAELASTAASLNWRDVCKVVPPNTTIIGIGDVTLTWNATAEQMINADIAWLFSPLNLSGNCTIKNIKVVAKNCRYAVHDETSNLTQYNGAKHIFKNCYFEMQNSDVAGSIAYGSGHNKNMTLIFDNCEFVNHQETAWSTHHQSADALEASEFTFNNCIFRTENTGLSQFFAVRFVTSVNNALKDRVRFNNCYIGGYMYFYASSSATQGYDVTLVGSSHVKAVYSDSITTRYAINQYNSVATE